MRLFSRLCATQWNILRGRDNGPITKSRLASLQRCFAFAYSPTRNLVCRRSDRFGPVIFSSRESRAKKSAASAVDLLRSPKRRQVKRAARHRSAREECNPINGRVERSSWLNIQSRRALGKRRVNKRSRAAHAPLRTLLFPLLAQRARCGRSLPTNYPFRPSAPRSPAERSRSPSG